PEGATEIRRLGETANLAGPRNVVASGCGRRGSRGLICPLPAGGALTGAAARPKRRGSAAGDPAPRNVVAPGCRTGRGTLLANALDAVHPGQDADLLKGADRL